MNDELISSIEDLGLSQKEARVYLANLMLGPATVQKIADQSGIKRVTTYVILESLNNLGLVSQSSRGKKTFFVAEEPKSLQRLLQKKEEAIKEQKSHFQAILPDLDRLINMPVESPNVRFYDTAEGIKTIMASFLESNREVGTLYGISNLDQIYAFFPEFRPTLANPHRQAAGIHSKFIYTSQEGPILKATDKESNRESRYVPSNAYPLNGDITIVGDHIVMLSLSGNKPIGITIQSQELAKALKAIFDLAWLSAAKYNQ
ncbi:MAG TPA: helix-turn-helix domain-containing protein [Candidatus Saccharimonadales bacterium]|nr:helix-turn-helix domain-containing protein [Candidatus Saccharimonadales bacterium]